MALNYNYDANLLEKVQTAPVINSKSDKIIYRDQQIQELYQLTSKFMNGSMSMEELVAEFRGGLFEN